MTSPMTPSDALEGAVGRLLDPDHVVPMETARLVDQRDLDAVLTVLRQRGEALEAIADESVFNQQRFAEDTDTDYFLRCFGAVKRKARASLFPMNGAEK